MIWNATALPLRCFAGHPWLIFAAGHCSPYEQYLVHVVNVKATLNRRRPSRQAANRRLKSSKLRIISGSSAAGIRLVGSC
jgi:hypothetical protein